FFLHGTLKRFEINQPRPKDLLGVLIVCGLSRG
ncbi:MAG: hypothetical protein ACI9XO_003820, partial [Paraglaciecola sp.]